MTNLSNTRWPLLAILALTAGCDLPGRPDPKDAPADKVMDFAILYRQNCSGCHGEDGKMGPGPPLNDPLFRAIVPEDELDRVITSGRKKTLMPAFAKENGGALTAAQIQVLVKEIKGIPHKIDEKKDDGLVMAKIVAPKWGKPDQQPESVPSYREPSANSKGSRAGDKEKGIAVFARACAACHGKDGEVIAINDPVFLALGSDQVLRRYIITGRSDLGMPGYAEARPDNAKFNPLTGQEIADLVALLASWRGEK